MSDILTALAALAAAVIAGMALQRGRSAAAEAKRKNKAYEVRGDARTEAETQDDPALIDRLTRKPR